MAVVKVCKRNGEIVSFDRIKIEVAMAKAFEASNTKFTAKLISMITDSVLEELEKTFDETNIPHVENIQDLVEKHIAENGHFNVAKSYIIYRTQRANARQENPVKESNIKVQKRSGDVEDFRIEEIENTLNMIGGHEANQVKKAELFGEIRNAVFDGIATKEINQIVMFSLRARTERDPVYSKLAARFLFNEVYKDVIGIDEGSKSFEKGYRSNFAKQIKKGIKGERLSKELAKFDLDKLSKAIEPSRDQLFHYLGAQVIVDRYLLQDSDTNILELPQYFWMRIAMGLALYEKKDKTEFAIKFYNLMSQLLYVPSTPTLLNAGTIHPQMSSCYLTTVEDDLHEIFKAFSDNAQLSKWSGGVGNDWSSVRGTGAWIKTTNVGSQGVIPFLKIVDSTTAAINRSGKRRGATAVYLETWHWDIESFLELKKNTGDDRRRTHDINTANWIPDLFMKRVLDAQMWTLFSPDETPELHHIYGKEFEKKYIEYEKKADKGEIKLFKKIPAKDLWRKMLTMLFETGHPWITFKDPSNIRSPQDHVGVVHGSNLCTEITLNTSKDEVAVCNLGSINLSRHVKDGSIDRELIKSTASLAMRMLDNIIDTNFYPIPEARNSNIKHRPVGLGVMGYQDMLYQMGINFDTDEAVELSDEVMELISYHAILGSSELAKERGTYKSYKGSKWDRGIFPLDTIDLLEEERGISTDVPKTARLDWETVKQHVKKYGMRNSNCMAIAPTATIANISGCFPSIEPIYKNLYVKSNFSGEFTVINHYLVEDLKKIDKWDGSILTKIKYYNGSVQNISEIPIEVRAKYKEVFEIDAHWIVKHAARRGKWMDQSQSVNVFTSTTSGQFISDVYITAWKMGLKTTYYLRTLAASSVEKSTIDLKQDEKSPLVQQETIEAAPPIVEVVEQTQTEQVMQPEFVQEEINPKLCRIDDPDCEACQ